MMRWPVSLQSLAAQCMALLLAIPLTELLQILFSFQATLWSFVFVQGGIAAALSRVWRQAAWWPPLHLVFLPTIFLARQAGLPAWIHLAIFVLLVLFYWRTFRTRVPL